jgi:ribonuclease P protein component
MIARPVKGHRTFSDAFLKGQRVKAGPLTLSVRCVALGEHPHPGEIRYGVTVARGRARSAVIRNRIKRLLRESIRRAVRTHAAAFARCGVETVIAVWGTAPRSPGRITLHDVQPHLDHLLAKVLTACSDPSDPS